MPTMMILILFRVHTHTSTGRLNHLIGTQCFKFQALSILMIPHYGPPLDTPEARAQAFRDNKGRWLNYHGTDHSFKRCPQPVAAALTHT